MPSRVGVNNLGPNRHGLGVGVLDWKVSILDNGANTVMRRAEDSIPSQFIVVKDKELLLFSFLIV